MNYWEQHYRDRVHQSKNRFFQVGKTQRGEPVNESQIDLIIQAVVSGLEIADHDRLLDIGCGNGLLTEKYAAIVDDVFGVDRSAELLDVARLDSINNGIKYTQCAITDNVFSNIFKNSGITKAVLYEVIQHLDIHNVKSVLDQFKNQTFKKLFIGGIPDKSKLGQFYDTAEKMAFYRKSIADNRPHLGRWWSFEELHVLCSQYKLNAKYVLQNKGLYTSHYRFDLLIGKQD